MITSRTPGSAVTSLELFGAPFQERSVGSVSIERTEGAHDLAEFLVNGLHPKAVVRYLDLPVRITIALDAHLRTTFVGYVNHVEPEVAVGRGLVNGSPIQQARIYCLGASRDMRGKRTAVWESYSLSDLTRILAQRYRYSFSVPEDHMRGRWVQRGDSDFALLAKAASSLGYKLTIHGTHIHIWDPAKALGRGLPTATLTAPVTQTSVHRGYAPGRILEMTGSFGKSGYKGDAHRKRVSFLDLDGNSFAIASEDLDLRTTTGMRLRSRTEDQHVMTANSYAEAERRLEAEVKDNHAFHATIRVRGVPWIVPGSMVQVTGYRGHYDGFWLVRGVKHEVVRGNFNSELEVSRDTTDEAPARLPSVRSADTPPEPVLVGAAWKASLMQEDIYV